MGKSGKRLVLSELKEKLVRDYTSALYSGSIEDFNEPNPK